MNGRTHEWLGEGLMERIDELGAGGDGSGEMRWMVMAARADGWGHWRAERRMDVRRDKGRVKNGSYSRGEGGRGDR